MVRVRFLAFIRSMTGVSEVELDDTIITVRDGLKKIAEMFPEISDSILDEVPDVNFVLGGRTLLIPKDLNLKLDQELIIAPIIDGG